MCSKLRQLVCNEFPVIYNGAPQAAIITGSVPGNVSNILYDGSAKAPTNAARMRSQQISRRPINQLR